MKPFPIRTESSLTIVNLEQVASVRISQQQDPSGPRQLAMITLASGAEIALPSEKIDGLLIALGQPPLGSL